MRLCMKYVKIEDDADLRRMILLVERGTKERAKPYWV